MERSPRPQDISWFLDLNRKGQLDLEPPYQRNSVWTRGDKQYFLDTIFNNFPCPAVFLHKTMSDEGETIYHVVDGKQRLKTILDFVNEETLSLSKEFHNTQLAGKKWKDLGSEDKKNFWNYLITVEMLPTVEDRLVTDIFERINKNARNLTRQELRHAKFCGWLSKFAEDESDKQEWKDFGVVSTSRAKRMRDVQFISELIMMSIKRDILGFDQDVLDSFYADYDTPVETDPGFIEDDFVAEFEKIKKFIAQMVNLESGVGRYCKVLAHFYSLWAYVLLEVTFKEEVSPQDFAPQYLAFMKEVDRVLSDDHTERITSNISTWALEYARNYRGASTDIKPRQSRHQALVHGTAVSL